MEESIYDVNTAVVRSVRLLRRLLLQRLQLCLLLLLLLLYHNVRAKRFRQLLVLRVQSAIRS